MSWYANEWGYIENGVIPKFAGCSTSVEWFTERGQWRDRNYTPKESDIIFFDWKSNGFIGTADHVGIVDKVIGNTVYTIEGNSGDMCKERTYEIGAADILGFGVPMY